MSPEEQEELASLYVLGALEGDELAAFERELTTHSELAVLVTELEEASTILATSVPQHKAPEVIRQSVFQHIRPALSAPPATEPPRRPAFSFAWIPWAIAAGLAVCCALLWNDKSRLTGAIGNVGPATQGAGSDPAIRVPTHQARGPCHRGSAPVCILLWLDTMGDRGRLGSLLWVALER